MSRKAAAIAAGVIVAAGASAAGAYAALDNHQPHAQPRAQAHVSPVADRHHAAVTPPPRPLRLLSVTPANGSRGVDGAGNITVTFSKPLPAGAALPRLSPAIAGSWQRAGDTVVFTPQAGFTAGTRVTVTVREGVSAVRSGYKSTFITASYSMLRLQELLAQLGYLPVTWTPAVGAAVPAGSAAAQLAAAYEPPPGTFGWQGGYPARLRSFWAQGRANLLDKGAIMGFEADRGMAVDGVAGHDVWAALH